MKTQIKTTDLLKLINPCKEGVSYKGENVLIDLSVLKEYVTYPKKHEVFTFSLDNQKNLYKNAALYIINSSEQAFICLDLNKEKPIESGLFEYIKSIYKKEIHITISIEKEDDNLLFINSKKLKPINNPTMDRAQDIEYSELRSVFVQSKKTIQEDVKIVKENKFFWQEDGDDLYSSSDWLMSKMQEIIKNKDSTFEINLLTLIKKIDTTLIESDDFKLKLLNLNDKNLNKFLLASDFKGVNFDFSKDLFQDKVAQDIRENRFYLLELLLQKADDKRTIDKINTIDFKKLVNTKETIKYLIEQDNYQSSYRSFDDKKFTILLCYPYMNDDNKMNSSIVSKYIDCITQKSQNEKYINDISMIFKLPAAVFDNPQHLIKVIPYVDSEPFAKYLNDHNHVNILLSEKSFLLENCSNISDYKIMLILNRFFKEENIDKEFIINLIDRSPGLFTEFSNTKNYLLKNKVSDLDIIMHAYNSGIKIKDISQKIMAKHLLTTGNKDEEIFKTKYVINHQMLQELKQYIYDTPELNKAFKNKYFKLENMFFKIDNYYHENKQAGKELRKIKDIEVFKELMFNIVNSPLKLEPHYRNLYAHMHPELKSNIKLLEDTGLLLKLKFSDLPETLQYNKKLAIQFVQEGIDLIPQQFFNDINFSLEFAKCLDKGSINKSEIPNFISKFFENQKVSSKYHEYLKSYISMNGINQILDKKEDTSNSKKMKI